MQLVRFFLIYIVLMVFIGLLVYVGFVGKWYILMASGVILGSYFGFYSRRDIENSNVRINFRLLLISAILVSMVLPFVAVVYSFNTIAAVEAGKLFVVLYFSHVILMLIFTFAMRFLIGLFFGNKTGEKRGR